MHHATQSAKNLWARFRAHALFISLIVLLPWLLFWRWLFKGEVLFWGTLLFQFWPWHHLTKTIALAGQWPLWNPLLGNGTPLLANLQSAFFYPLNLLYFLIPVEHGLTLSIILHLILAGLLMYAYARAISLSPFAATVTALAYMFSGYVMGRTQFVTMVNAAAWIPLLLLLTERLATRRTYINVVWLALALAVQFLAGHAQLWFYTLWLLTAYLVFRSWQEAKHWRAIFYSLWQWGLGVGISVLLAAAQILPTAELMLQSPRNSGADTFFALSYSFWPWRFITLLAPNFFGHPAQGNYWGYANYWEDHAYVGLLPLILALVAIWNLRTRKHLPQPMPVYQRVTPFFAALIPISLILALGWNTPIYLWVFKFVPGFGYFQAPARLLIWYTVAVTVLAGVGAQTFKLTPKSRPGWRRLLMGGVGILMASIAGQFVLTGRSRTFVDAAVTMAILLIGSILLLLLRPAQKSSRKNLWQGAALLFIALDLLCFAAPLLPMLPHTIYTTPIATAEILSTHLHDQRFFVDDEFDHQVKFNQYFRFDTFGPLNLEHWQNFKNTLVPNVGVFAQLPATNNDDPLVVGRHKILTDLIKHADAPQKAKLMALTNAGYVVDSPQHIAWPTIYTDTAIAIQKLPAPVPRAYFTAQVQWVSTQAEAREKLLLPNFDPQRDVIITNADNDVLSNDNSPVNIQPVDVSQPNPHRVELTLNAPTNGFVILTDTYYPGWRATVNGQSVDIWPANIAFRAVAVNAGENEIVFEYESQVFTIGLWISVITLVGVVMMIGLRVKK